MKRSWFYGYSVAMALAIVVIGIGSFSTVPTGAHNFEIPPTPQTDPSASLSRGRALLKQGHADQALPLLESALNSSTQTNNARGIAAT